MQGSHSAAEVRALIDEWDRIRDPIERSVPGRTMDAQLLTRAISLSRRCDSLAREVPTEHLARLNEIRTWFVNQGLPSNLSRQQPLSREEVVALLRENSGADLSMALTERFGITDDDLKREFKYVLGEDVSDAAFRARKALDERKRGAIPAGVREDILTVLDAILNSEAEVVE